MVRVEIIIKYHLGKVVAYYDYQKSTIRHINCSMQTSELSPSHRCEQCRAFRDNYLRRSLNRLLKSQEEGTVEARCDIHSHTTFKNLTTPQKAQRYKNVCDSYRQSQRKVNDLEKRLLRLIQAITLPGLETGVAVTDIRVSRDVISHASVTLFSST